MRTQKLWQVRLMTSDPDVRNLNGTPMRRNVSGERRGKRHDGRSLKTSICDIIDNSIDAGASEIRIVYGEDIWRGEPSGALRIEDNGVGIPAGRMEEAISFNSEREDGYNWWELGSFGVGLDDSCLAHGDEITVFSKQSGCDFQVIRLSGEKTDTVVNDWMIIEHEEMIHNLPEAWNTVTYTSALRRIQEIDQGTIVILEVMDPPTLSIEEGLEPFAEIENFIALTFHDYLVGIDLGPRIVDEPLSIFFNSLDEPVVPLDPFFKSEIGVGILNGQDGTYMHPYQFTHNGMEFTINRYIIPKSSERVRRYVGGDDEDGRPIKHDNRMTSAIRNSIEQCQGIYFKRNGRILDGPWNGKNWRRNHGMGMGPNHWTVARWEFVLPHESINDPNLVSPDKRSVNCDDFLTHILRANQEKVLWHPEDAIPYGPSSDDNMSRSGNQVGVQFNKRARCHNNSRDTPKFCAEGGCEARIHYNQEFCEAHQSHRCLRCNQIVEAAGAICNNCAALVCQSDGCDSLVEDGESQCLACLQPTCAAESCEERSSIPTEYCSIHEARVCLENNCRNISAEGFNRCAQHLVIFEDDENDLNVRLVRAGVESEPIIIDGNNINLNLDREEIARLSDDLNREISGV